MVLPASHKVPRAPWYSGSRPLASRFAYGTFTLCGLGFPTPHSATLHSVLPVRNPVPKNTLQLVSDGLMPPLHLHIGSRCNLFSGPVWTNPRSLATTCGITVVFFSCGYLDVSVPHVSPPYTMDSCKAIRAFTPDGFPHSDIRGSKAICASPRLFAAYRVLHRQLAPRHPPCALSSLTFFVILMAPHRSYTARATCFNLSVLEDLS